MNKAIDNLTEAQKFAMSIRPKVGGFPYLAQGLRAAGVTRNSWCLRLVNLYLSLNLALSCNQASSLISGACEVARFKRDSLFHALRTDQAGKSSFPEFLKSSREAGVVNNDVDLENRKVTCHGVHGESDVEAYPAVEIRETGN